MISGEEIPSIDLVVAQELVDSSMKVVRARLGDEVNRRPRRLAEGSRINVGLNLELLNRVRRRLQSEGAKRNLPSVHAVEQGVVARVAIAVGRVGLLTEG